MSGVSCSSCAHASCRHANRSLRYLPLLVPASIAIRQNSDLAGFLDVGASYAPDIINAMGPKLGHQLFLCDVFLAHAAPLHLSVLDQADAVGLKHNAHRRHEKA